MKETQLVADELAAADGKRRLFELWQRLPGQQREQGDEALMRLRVGNLPTAHATDATSL